MAAEVWSAISDKGLPFLDRFESWRSIYDFLRTEDTPLHTPGLKSIYLAIVQAKLGDLEAARASLISSAWRERADTVAQHLGFRV
jgi:hypothetical protein